LKSRSAELIEFPSSSHSKILSEQEMRWKSDVPFVHSLVQCIYGALTVCQTHSTRGQNVYHLSPHRAFTPVGRLKKKQVSKYTCIGWLAPKKKNKVGEWDGEGWWWGGQGSFLQWDQSVLLNKGDLSAKVQFPVDPGWL
jgi:hypothetical protein